MIKYNLVIIENKQCIPFLNLTEQTFYDKLWEWTYVDDLWDYINEVNPSKEDLEKYLFTFIIENMFHKYEDDDIDCFAFINGDLGIAEYEINSVLYDFIMSKITEHYDSISSKC